MSVTGCSGVGGGGDDGRNAAAQLALDAQPRTVIVPNGKSCHIDIYWRDEAPKNFKGVPGVTVVASGTETSFMGTSPCTTVTWPKSVIVPNPLLDTERAAISIGHFVLDKLGDNVDAGTGTFRAPFKAHFEASTLGGELIKRKLATAPSDITDGTIEFHKDADGKWVARELF